MIYKNVIEGKFIARPNRFIAYVLVDGVQETVHVKNTGRCRELLLPGSRVILEISDNPKRKTKYDLIAVYKDAFCGTDTCNTKSAEDKLNTLNDITSNLECKEAVQNELYNQRDNTDITWFIESASESVRRENFGLINMDSQAPNKVVLEWLKKQDFDYIKPEYTYGKSRVDFYMEKGQDKYLMEVKGCTLEIDGVGYFPDAPTERGVKHLHELRDAAKLGYKAAIAFVIQMAGIFEVRPNISTHPEFGTALAEAEAAGVKVLFLLTRVTPNSLEITKCIVKGHASDEVIATLVKE